MVALPCIVARGKSVGKNGVRFDYVFEAPLGLVPSQGGLVGVVPARQLTICGAYGGLRALDLAPLRQPPRAALDRRVQLEGRIPVQGEARTCE